MIEVLTEFAKAAKETLTEGLAHPLEGQIDAICHEAREAYAPLPGAESLGESAFSNIPAISDTPGVFEVPEPFRQFYPDGRLDLRSVWAREIKDSKNDWTVLDSEKMQYYLSSTDIGADAEQLLKELPPLERKYFVDESLRVNPHEFGKAINCYQYAVINEPLNAIRKYMGYNKLQPGEIAGKACEFTRRDSPETVRRAIVDGVKADCGKLGKQFIELSGKDVELPQGYRKVFLAYSTLEGDLKGDYHWWFQTPFGDWFHKPGGSPLRFLDASGKRISDPLTCDRGIYDTPMGFFAVGEGSIEQSLQGRGSV